MITCCGGRSENNYWPAHYFIDAQGRVRYYHHGEGEYALSERVIRQLLAKAGHAPRDMAMAKANASGAEAAALADIQSGETYIGYARAANFVSPGGLQRDAAKTYAGAPLSLNDWSHRGRLDRRQAERSLNRAGAKISFRFHARDLHLVLGPMGGKPVRFRVTLDGRAPGGDAGNGDVKPDGGGTVSEQQLYQLVGRRARCATAPSPSNSSTPAPKLSRLPSADAGRREQELERDIDPRRPADFIVLLAREVARQPVDVLLVAAPRDHDVHALLRPVAGRKPHDDAPRICIF